MKMVFSAVAVLMFAGAVQAQTLADKHREASSRMSECGAIAQKAIGNLSIGSGSVYMAMSAIAEAKDEKLAAKRETAAIEALEDLRKEVMASLVVLRDGKCKDRNESFPEVNQK